MQRTISTTPATNAVSVVAKQLDAIRDELSKENQTFTGSIIRIGEKLARAHKLLAGPGRSGKFRDFVDSTPISRRTAYRAMDVYRVFQNCASVARFQTTALHALSHKNCPEGALKEAIRLAGAGQLITAAVANKLIEYFTVESNGQERPTFAPPDLTNDKIWVAKGYGSIVQIEPSIVHPGHHYITCVKASGEVLDSRGPVNLSVDLSGWLGVAEFEQRDEWEAFGREEAPIPLIPQAERSAARMKTRRTTWEDTGDQQADMERYLKRRDAAWAEAIGPAFDAAWAARYRPTTETTASGQ